MMRQVFGLIIILSIVLNGCASNLSDKRQIQYQINKYCKAIYNGDVNSLKMTLDPEGPSYNSMAGMDLSGVSQMAKKRFNKNEFKCTIVKEFKLGKNLKKGISERTQKDLKVKAFIVRTPAIDGKEKFDQSVYIFRHTGGNWKYYVNIPIDIAKIIDNTDTTPEKLIDGFFNPGY